MINVALAADSMYLHQLSVVVAGITEYAEGVPHRVFVLHDGYGADAVEQVERSAGPEVTMRWLEAGSGSVNEARLPSHLPVATLFRLRLTELLPADVDRVIYLDTDTVVRSSLDDLWALDLGGSAVGAVRDPVLGWAGSYRNVDWRTLDVAPDMPYFNAGVMLVPLASWRESSICERAMDLVASNLFIDGDQGALNVAIGGQWAQIDPRWNLQGGHLASEHSHAWVIEPAATLDAALLDPAVVHFNRGPWWRRPWDDRRSDWRLRTHPFADDWYGAIDRTAFAGWRPDLRRPSRVSGAARRAAGAFGLGQR